MKEQLITFETAKLANGKRFDIETYNHYQLKNGKFLDKDNYQGQSIKAPTQSLLQKWLRETRGVHIEIYRNASGYYWGMCRSDGGTGLGWSHHSGPNMGGVWNTYEDALENSLQVQLSYDLPEDTKTIKHWGNYVEFILESIYIKTVKTNEDEKN
jgi:hypothetical protein